MNGIIHIYSRLKDPEELRHDRATKISRKELADLMAELLDCGNEAFRVSIIYLFQYLGAEGEEILKWSSTFLRTT